MLKEFLKQLGKTTGKTYTQEEFKAILSEAFEVDAKSISDKEKLAEEVEALKSEVALLKSVIEGDK